VTVLAFYYLVLGVLAAYGTHRILLVIRYRRTRRHPSPSPPPPRDWPLVTVQLPLYNERYVAERLLDAACRLDYPSDRLEIQVLDDSTDDTVDIVARAVERYQRQGVRIHHLHREQRHGFKAGALAAGQARAAGELLAVFDADFVPPSDFLRRAVPHFRDPRVGMVQGRWAHINRDDSLLTRVQAILLDGHFLVEHAARHRSGCFFNFNGTAGMWRKEAIDDAGGWQHDTLTEDLDLSYRAQLKGWQFVYLSDLQTPAELPAEVNAFKSQQHRWAKGSIQTGRKLLQTVLAAPQPARVKLEAFVHLTNNACYLLMVLLGLLLFPAMYLRRDTESWKLLAIDLPLFFAATVSIIVFYLTSQAAAGRPLWREALRLPAVMATGMGLSLHNAGAVLAGLLQRGGVFHRTPKVGIHPRRQRSSPGGYRVPLRLSYFLEGLFALYFASCSWLAVTLEMWLALPFLFLFLKGYTYLFLLATWPSRWSLRSVGERAAEAPT
jgi:cellulose synthase/poly-beta-1,6-N-acetylglucosamine synthase-like glycosyltransferase